MVAMKNTFTDRLLATAAFVSLLAVAVALVSQHMFDIQPCAWCVLQRLIYVCIAIVCIVALASRRAPSAQRVLIGLAVLLAIGGVAAAIYQHNVASHLLSCSQTFADKFITQTGLDENLPSIFGIYATCADAAVNVLGVKYEIWSMLVFLVLVVGLVAAFVRGGAKEARLFS